MTIFHGLGPLPGTDIRATADVLAGEAGATPHLPILADRGIGADPIGRTSAICADLDVDAGPRSWRIVDRAGRAGALARDHLDRDLDVCEQYWASAPDTVFVPVTGPWTLAAAIELPTGHRMLSDRGAVAYLAASLAEGLAVHAADVARRFSADVRVIIDEPAAAAVAAGRIGGAVSGTVLPAVGHREMSEIWRAVTSAAGIPAATVAVPGLGERRDTARGPLPERAILEPALLDSGAAAIGLPLGSVRGSAVLDAVGRLRSSGLDLAIGAVPAEPGLLDDHTGAPREPEAADVAGRVARLWDELSFPRADLLDHVALTVDRCVAGAPVSWVAPAYAGGRRAAELMSRAAGDL